MAYIGNWVEAIVAKLSKDMDELEKNSTPDADKIVSIFTDLRDARIYFKDRKDVDDLCYRLHRLVSSLPQLAVYQLLGDKV